MRRIATVTLLGLLAGFLALPALAAESRGFEVSVLVDGYRVSEYPWQGRTYVEALRGRSFTLRISNPTAERVAESVRRLEAYAERREELARRATVPERPLAAIVGDIRRLQEDVGGRT